MTFRDLYFGSSLLWKAALECVELLGSSSLPILLTGPTGSGKTAVAELIHERSRPRGPFVDCALPEIPDGLRHSYLSGHARGAFTGASADQMGRIEEANGGTLFLDELSLASEEVRSLLLLVLERQWVTRVGEQRQRPVNVRFIFATNEEPTALLAAGTWRKDFYYRLGFGRIRLPSLSAVREDILPLATRLLHHFLAMRGVNWRPGFSPPVRALFQRHPWPGNIRELKSVCERAAAVLREPRDVDLCDFDPDFLAESEPANAPSPRDAFAARALDALRRHGGNKSAAARELGVRRQALYRLDAPLSLEPD